MSQTTDFVEVLIARHKTCCLQQCRMIYYSCTKQAANISNIYMKDFFMNIIHYYNACRHISYYNQAFKWQGGYVNITFNEKNNKSLSFMIMFLS